MRNACFSLMIQTNHASQSNCIFTFAILQISFSSFFHPEDNIAKTSSWHVWKDEHIRQAWIQRRLLIQRLGLLNLLLLLATNLFNGVGVSLDEGDHLHSQNTRFEGITGVVTAFNSSTAGLAVSDCIALVSFHGSSHGLN